MTGSSRGRRTAWIAAGGSVLFVVAMVVIPHWVPVQEDVASVAAARGYSNAAAWVIAALWTAAAVAFGVRAVARDRSSPISPGTRPNREPDPPWIALVIAAFVLLAYFPPFLAQTGPFIEETIFLTATQRMLAGMVPYRDFEFLYGPLMLYPAYGWSLVFGYSLASFYAYVAALEVLVAVGLFALVRALVPGRAERWAAFAVLAVVFTTALMGPNWSGMRRLPALVAIVLLATDPLSNRRALASSALCGIQLAYSHDLGVATLAAAGVLYGMTLLRDRRALPIGISYAAVAVGSWAAISWALLGDAFPNYVREARLLTSRFVAGEANFEFAWTVNSAVLFALLAVSGVAAGVAIRRPAARERFEVRLLIAAIAFAVLGLRSGLGRLDMWHLNVPFAALILVWWLPGAWRGFGLGPRVRRIARALTVAIAASYGFGLLPSISWVANGWLRGARATLTGTGESAPDIETAAPALELERASPNSATVALARYLADRSPRGRPVLFYSTAYGAAVMAGVVKRDFLNDDFLYSRARGERARRFLEDHPDAHVVLRDVAWERLTSARDSIPAERVPRPSVVKTLAGWISSPHYGQLLEEARLREARWDRTVGAHVVGAFRPVARFGPWVVLAPVADAP